ncbi:MAG: MFS transporter [Patescibacteria group bacterium]
MTQNYKHLIIASSLYSFAVGFFSPFWILYLSRNGASQFGYLIGVSLLATAIFAYLSGKYSDKIGRVPILSASWFLTAVVISLYPSTYLPWHIYALQIASGILIAVHQTAETALLGDLTLTETRGSKVGTYRSITSVFVGGSVILGGLLAAYFPVETFFYITSVLLVVSSALILRIRQGPPQHRSYDNEADLHTS